MSWSDIGFNENLSVAEIGSQQLDPLAFEQFTQEISGSKLSGLLQSQDGRVKVDLDNNTIIISDGIVERVRLGKQADDSYGFILKDKSGNILIQFNDLVNLIQSPDTKLKLNFDNNNLTVSDDGGIRVILGKLSD